MAARVAVARAPHAPMASRSVPGRAAPAGQQQIVNATAPMSSAKEQKASHRTAANTTAVSLPGGAWRLAGFTAVLLGAPTENVNAPCTGWESADITCQPTV